MQRVATEAEWGKRGEASPGAMAARGTARPAVSAVDGLIERPDGNNVSIDREGLNMAEAQLRFRTGVELMKREFSRISDAIHEDK
jgi:flagellar basal-body rod protein FlgB